MRKGLEDFSLLLRRWTLTAVWMGLMLYACTDVASGAQTGSVLHGFLASLGLNLSPEALSNINLFIRKAAHVSEFAILAILLWRDGEPLMKSFREPYDFRLAAGVLVVSTAFAALSETIQRYFPSRGPSIHDVVINACGATLGLFIIWVMRRRASKKSAAKTTILFTADLHLDTESLSLGQLKAAIEKTRPGLCVIAGDLGTADRAAHWLAELAKTTAGTRLIVCLGNQDHWLDRERHTEFTGPSSVREKIWRPALQAAGIPCLDFGNVELDDFVLTGGYGHFDLGMQAPGFRLAGMAPTLEHYQKGEFCGLVSNDIRYLPHASSSLAREACLQAEGISSRLAKALATGKRIILVTHTVPFSSLNAQAGQTSKPTRFSDAYSGNTLVGDALSLFRGKIELAVCGHTHAHVPLKIINGIPCINIGSDYGALNFVLFDSSRPAKSATTFRSEI